MFLPFAVGRKKCHIGSSGAAGPSIFLVGSLDPKQFVPSMPCLVDLFPTVPLKVFFGDTFAMDSAPVGWRKGLQFGAEKLCKKGQAGHVMSIWYNLVNFCMPTSATFFELSEGS